MNVIVCAGNSERKVNEETIIWHDFADYAIGLFFDFDGQFHRVYEFCGNRRRSAYEREAFGLGVQRLHPDLRRVSAFDRPAVRSFGTQADLSDQARAFRTHVPRGWAVLKRGVYNRGPGASGHRRVDHRHDDAVIHWEAHPYAVPTPDHFLPLILCLGAAKDEKARVFNDVCNLGAIAMTGFVLG